MDAHQVSVLKRIMQENARLKKPITERDLEFEVMKEIALENSVRMDSQKALSELIAEKYSTLKSSSRLMKHISFPINGLR